MQEYDCDYIKKRLDANCLTKVWLIHELEKRGITVGFSELCNYLALRRNGAKTKKVLQTSINIIAEYERCYGYKHK